MNLKAALAGGGGWIAAIALLLGGGVGDITTDGDLDGPAGVFAPAPDDKWLDFCQTANAVVKVDDSETERIKAQRGAEELNWPTTGGNVNANYYADFGATPEPVTLSEDARACLTQRSGG